MTATRISLYDATAVAFFDDDYSPPEPAALVRPEIPGDIPRGRGGRPKVRALKPDGTEDPDTLVEYTRASSLGDVLEDMFAINLRQKRMVAWALGHDPALRARAQAVATITEPGDKKDLKEIVDTALVVCRASTGADRGTAVHALSEQFDQGLPLGHLDDDLATALGNYAQLMAGFEIIASETFVVCDELEAAGSFDRVVSPRWPMEVVAKIGGKRVVLATILPGERVVLDLKTTAEAKYFGCSYAVQQPTYANGVPYTFEGGRGAWPDGLAPRTDWALLLHVPIESPEDAALWWVDLTAGMELARLAAQARVVRRRAGMFLPAQPPEPAAGDDGLATPSLEQEEAARAMPQLNSCVECDQETENEGLCTPCDEAMLVAVRAEKRGKVIIGLLHAARSSDDLVKIWERYAQDGWTPICASAADAQMAALRVTT